MARGKTILAYGNYYAFYTCSRPPRGGRGLKHHDSVRPNPPFQSPPTRGAWIETSRPRPICGWAESPPTRGAWIETLTVVSGGRLPTSPPTRGAWIETAVKLSNPPPSHQPADDIVVIRPAPVPIRKAGVFIDDQSELLVGAFDLKRIGVAVFSGAC